MKNRSKNTINKEERLNKLIADSGYCSRRKADVLIAEGKVNVDGKIVKELGFKTSIDSFITVDGDKIQKQKKVYILFNKPKDCICTVSDPENRTTIFDYIKTKYKGLHPVGRLDRNTTGVLLITNDGDLTFALTHPSKNIKKTYHASLNKNLTRQDAINLVNGVEIDNELNYFDSVSYLSDKDLSKVEVNIHSGKYHFVIIMFEKFGYSVKNLDRIYFAGITKKSLKRGEWRYLSNEEIMVLTKHI